jgi:hypothetical protein
MNTEKNQTMQKKNQRVKKLTSLNIKGILFTIVVLSTFSTCNYCIGKGRKTQSKERFNRCDLTISKFKDSTLKQNFIFPSDDSELVQISQNLSFSHNAAHLSKGCLYLNDQQIRIDSLLETKKYKTKRADYSIEKYSVNRINKQKKYTIIYITDQSWSSSISENNLIVVVEEASSNYVYALGFTPCVNGNNLLMENGILTSIAMQKDSLILYSLVQGEERIIREYKLLEIEDQGCGLYRFR